MEFYRHELDKGTTRAWSVIAHSRIFEIKDQIADLETEKEHWEALLDQLRPCIDCNGHGEIKEQQDTSFRFIKCNTCDGTGKEPTCKETQ